MDLATDPLGYILAGVHAAAQLIAAFPERAVELRLLNGHASKRGVEKLLPMK